RGGGPRRRAQEAVAELEELGRLPAGRPGQAREGGRPARRGGAQLQQAVLAAVGRRQPRVGEGPDQLEAARRLPAMLLVYHRLTIAGLQGRDSCYRLHVVVNKQR